MTGHIRPVKCGVTDKSGRTFYPRQGMPAPASDFVAQVMAALGADGPTDLSRKLGLGESGPRRIKRWLEGVNEPDYEATMLMLERAGWLTSTPGAAAGPGGSTPDPLRALAEAVADLARANLDYGARLEEVERRLESAPASRARAPKGKKRSASGRR
jgi:hypothetical protein